MISRIEKILSLLLTGVLLLLAGCSDAKEEYSSPEQQDAGDNNGQSNNGQSNNGDADAADQADADASRPTQPECDTATNEQECLQMGCQLWLDVLDVSNASGDSVDQCNSAAGTWVEMCFSSDGEGGAASASYQYRQRGASWQVIRYPSYANLDGFTQCSNGVPQPPEPAPCGCFEIVN